MGEKKNRQFSREFKLGAVERMRAGESPSALQRELGVKRKSLYEWKKRVEDGGPQNLRDGGRPGPIPGGVVVDRNKSDERRIAELERLVGKQQALIHFFENAFEQVEAATAGKAESTKRFGKSANEREPS
ncbi:MAG: helix-turn-helix domain-containing protein [Acidobacteria bacterium]|nr:helix-turn-helix domain-containing protein [Acidobacteriota bacterium]